MTIPTPLRGRVSRTSLFDGVSALKSAHTVAIVFGWLGAYFILKALIYVLSGFWPAMDLNELYEEKENWEFLATGYDGLTPESRVWIALGAILAWLFAWSFAFYVWWNGLDWFSIYSFASLICGGLFAQLALVRYLKDKDE